MKKLLSTIFCCLYIAMTVFNPIALADGDLTISVKTDRTSSVFYENETAKFYVNLANGSTAKSCSIEYKIIFKNYNYDSYKSNVDEAERKTVKVENKDLKPNESFEDVLYYELENEKYGIYSLNVTVTDTLGGKYEKQFSFAKSTVSEKLNKTFGASLHLTRYADADTVFSLMKSAGLGLARDDFNWDKYEKNTGGYKLDERQVSTLENAKRYGIDMLAIMTGYNKLYRNTKTKFAGIPNDSVYDENTGKTYADAYKNYVSSFINEPLVKNTVTMIEVINEPLGEVKETGKSQEVLKEEYYNAGKAYSNAVKAAYTAVEENNSPIKVGAFSAFRLGYQAEYFIDGALSQMDKPYYDAFTLHDYKERGTDGDPEPGYTSPPGKNWFSYLDSATATVEHFDNLMSGKTKGPASDKVYKFPNSVRWYTERGFSTDDKPNDDKYEPNYSNNPYYDQALNLVRSKIVTDAYNGGNMTDKTWIYDFSDDPKSRNLGIRESSFGIVESHEDENPYAAKPAYVAVANYNSLAADAAKCEKLYDDGTHADTVYSGKDDKSGTSGKYIYKYTCPDRDVYVLYHSIGNDPSNVQELEYQRIGGGKEVHIYDFWGNEIRESDIYKDGKYQLTKQPFYICVGKPVNRNLLPKGAGNSIDKVVVDGYIESKQSDKRISLIVAPENIGTDKLSPENALYIDQKTTDKDGYFCFEFGVHPQSEGYTAYITSEDCGVPLVFDIENGRTEKISIYLTEGVLKLKPDDYKLVDLSNLSAQIEYTIAGNVISYKLYCAVYKNNMLTGFREITNQQSEPKLDKMSEGIEKYSFDMKDNNTVPDFDRISLYMSDSINILKPICTAYTINKNHD